MSDLHVSNVKRWLLKSPPVEWAIWTAREILIGTLRQGPIPQHVAFEMDGNRRYAQNHQIETIQGHHLGFEALSRVLEICYKSGVKVVTVYAFSIENFNRPKSEVKGLMAMAKVKLEQLVQHGELLDRYGARVKICGERNLIPADVLPFVDKAVEMTKHNKDAVLNICFPYTARAEITSAVKATIDEFTSPSPLPQSSAPFSQSRIEQKIRDNQAKSGTAAPQRDASPEPAKSDVDDSGRSSTAIDPDSPTLRASGRASLQNPENITAETINSHTYTAEDPPLDIFIRTSGVRRLSDFMLWQCHENTHIFFLQCFWPDFDLWHFVPVLLEWQWRQKKTMEKEGARRRVKDRAE